MKLRNSSRSWSLVIGVLLLLIACIVGYFSTKSAEADVSMIQELVRPSVAESA